MDQKIELNEYLLRKKEERREGEKEGERKRGRRGEIKIDQWNQDLFYVSL